MSYKIELDTASRLRSDGSSSEKLGKVCGPVAGTIARTRMEECPPLRESKLKTGSPIKSMVNHKMTDRHHDDEKDYRDRACDHGNCEHCETSVGDPLAELIVGWHLVCFIIGDYRKASQMAIKFAVLIPVREKRNASLVTLRLCDSDTERLRALCVYSNGDYEKHSTVAYRAFRRGLSVMEGERKALNGSGRKSNGSKTKSH